MSFGDTERYWGYLWSFVAGVFVATLFFSFRIKKVEKSESLICIERCKVSGMASVYSEVIGKNIWCTCLGKSSRDIIQIPLN